MVRRGRQTMLKYVPRSDGLVLLQGLTTSSDLVTMTL